MTAQDKEGSIDLTTGDNENSFTYSAQELMRRETVQPGHAMDEIQEEGEEKEEKDNEGGDEGEGDEEKDEEEKEDKEIKEDNIEEEEI